MAHAPDSGSSGGTASAGHFAPEVWDEDEDRTTAGELRAHTIANVTVVLIGLGLLAIGAFAIASPETAAVLFGVPMQATEAKAYVLATAIRDVAIGCWFLTLLALQVRRQTLGASLIVVALIPIGDFINVYSNTGKGPALLLHGGSSVAFLALGVWLWRTDLSR
jgi:hypothetical protein